MIVRSPASRREQVSTRMLIGIVAALTNTIADHFAIARRAAWTSHRRLGHGLCRTQSHQSERTIEGTTPRTRGPVSVAVDREAIQQLSWPYLQAVGQAKNIVESDAALTALNMTDKGPVDAGASSKGFL